MISTGFLTGPPQLDSESVEKPQLGSRLATVRQLGG